MVKEDKIMIVDEFTGRIMPNRSWSEGLHPQRDELFRRFVPSPVRASLAGVAVGKPPPNDTPSAVSAPSSPPKPGWMNLYPSPKTRDPIKIHNVKAVVLHELSESCHHQRLVLPWHPAEFQLYPWLSPRS